MTAKRTIVIALLAGGLIRPGSPIAAESPGTQAVMNAEPLHVGRIAPELFGNFIEPLNDVVPGLWAEMLNDRSFEGVLKPANWCYFDDKPDFCDHEWDRDEKWRLDTVNPFNGTRSAGLTSDRRKPAALTQSGLAVRKGRDYLFSGYFRTDNRKVQAVVVLKALLPDGAWMTLASARLPALSEGWQKHAARLACRGTTDRAVFELRVEGQGQVWVDKVSLMPADNLRGWRRDVVEVVKGLRPGIIRWGGSAVDPGGYRWQNGIGDRDRRTPFLNEPWGRLDANDVGMDEFCEFCELVGAEPLICVSFAAEEQSAADLVQYCNGSPQTTWGAKRAANGHAQPNGVKHWQVGNEISRDDENYLSRFKGFAQAIKRTSPDALLLASFPSRKLLEGVGKETAYVAPHHYTPDVAGCDRDLGELSRLIVGCIAGWQPAPGPLITALGRLSLRATSWVSLKPTARKPRFVRLP